MGEVSVAISAAVEEQSVTTREIASSIQAVAGSTAEAAQAMVNVVEVADRAGEASRNILAEAAEIGTESAKLCGQVEHFLGAVKADTNDRRQSERIAGNGVTVTLRLPGAAASETAIHDLSRTGISVRYSGVVEVGQDVEIDLPNSAGAVTGRVVRATRGVVAILFSEQPIMLSRADKAFASMTAGRKAA